MFQSESFKRNAVLLLTARSSGQTAILITVLLCLAVLIGFSLSLGTFSQQASQRNITTKKALQSYYVAMHGIQEALGTRMVPRSNQLNYRMITNSGQLLGQQPQIFSFSVPDTTAPLTPLRGVRVMSYYNLSGLAFTNARRMTGNFTRNDIMGVYRYVVVGGDPARVANTGRYFYDPGQPGGGTSRAGNGNLEELKLITQPFAFPERSSPFYIVSNGITCIPRRGGVAQGNQLVINPYPGRPTCQDQANFILDETNLVARVELERSQLQDLVQAIKIFEPDRMSHILVSRPRPERVDPAQENWVEFPFGQDQGGAFIPGLTRNGGEFDTYRTQPTPGTPNNTFRANFEDIWRSGIAPQNGQPGGNQQPVSNVRLAKIMVYQAATTQRPINFVGGATAADFLAAVDENVNVPTPATLNGVTNINLANPLRVSSTIRLFFNGPVDFRSFYRYQVNSCAQRPEYCNIQLRAGTELRDINFVPLLPSSTSVIITPSFIPGQTHTLSVGGLRTYSGVPVPAFNITFQVPNT